MRIETYKRELTEYGYTVIGSSWDYNQHDNYSCPPISMTLTDTYGFPPVRLDHPLCDNLEELIKIAELGVDPEDDESYVDFCKNYAEIMRGNRSDWQLGEFEVFVGGLTLSFGNRLTQETGWLSIVGARRLRLTFKTPRSVLGFDPTYYVHIEHDNDGKHLLTKVTEDLGYMRRENNFKIKDDEVEEDGTNFQSGQYLEITEYTGI